MQEGIQVHPAKSDTDKVPFGAAPGIDRMGFSSVLVDHDEAFDDATSLDASRWGAGFDRLSRWLSYRLVVAGLR